MRPCTSAGTPDGPAPSGVRRPPQGPLVRPEPRLTRTAEVHRAQRQRGREIPYMPRRPRLSRRSLATRNRVSSCQFQALFNSLFKVLCIFPSRYLFAIGLSPVFSFRWNLPPASDCTPKQPDSTRTHRAAARPRGTGFSPSPIPRSKGFERGPRPMTPLQTTIRGAEQIGPPD